MGRWKAAASLLSRISRSPSSHNLQPRNSVHSVLLNPRRPTLFRRLFSAIPSSVSDLDPGLHDFGGYDYDAELPEERETGNIPIKAFFLCTSIDLKSLQAENKNDVLPATSRSSNYIALKYRDFPSEITGLGANTRSCRYMVVCQYGSAVLFNVDDHEVESYLRIVQRHSTGFLQDIKKDDYAVKENPLLVGEMQGGPDYIVLKALDTDGIRIIGSVLGQSIALDYFVSQVDGMVEKFAEINRIMEKSGTFTMDRKNLLQLLGQANSNLADVILKVGLFERSEIAWRDAKYAQIYEYLRDEYEVTQRFGNLNFKLKFVEHNIHFLQDVLQNQRSNLLEWCIIFLLSIENIISLYEIIRESDQAPLILQQAAQEIPADALTNFLCSF